MNKNTESIYNFAQTTINRINQGQLTAEDAKNIQLMASVLVDITSREEYTATSSEQTATVTPEQLAFEQEDLAQYETDAVKTEDSTPVNQQVQEVREFNLQNGPVLFDVKTTIEPEFEEAYTDFSSDYDREREFEQQLAELTDRAERAMFIIGHEETAVRVIGQQKVDNAKKWLAQQQPVQKTADTVTEIKQEAIENICNTLDAFLDNTANESATTNTEVVHEKTHEEYEAETLAEFNRIMAAMAELC